MSENRAAAWSSEAFPADANARDKAFARLASLDAPDVLVVGGGVNGVALLRDLALNNVSAVLIDTGDFCSGASGASSRMAHGGLRYLEGREFGLVGEAARERNRLLHDAPHFVRPLETVVPLRHLVLGLPSAILRFLNWSKAPGPMSLAAIKAGLLLYERLGSVRRALPGHVVHLSRRAFSIGLPQDVRAVVHYFDGQILQPEALVLEMLDDAVRAPGVVAINHVGWQADGNGGFQLRDRLSDRTVFLRPKVVVNAAGSAIDRVNAALGIEKRMVRGVKGAHIVLRHPDLSARMAGRAFYFDDGSGRMVICLPVGETVLMGTTEVESSDPADRSVDDAEIDYLLRSLGRLFVDIPVGRQHVVAVTSGIRPLKASHERATQAARDHALVEARYAGLPVICLVGGKWTTFRSFAEQAADLVLTRLGRARTATTADRAYPGAERLDLLAVSARTGLSPSRIEDLAGRYGARAEEVAIACAAGSDRPITGFADFTEREIAWLAQERMACTLEDLVLRRTGLVLTGRLSRPALVDLATVLAAALGHDEDWASREVESCAADPRILGLAGGGEANR